MSNDKKALLYAGIAVLSWSTVATAFKITLRYLSTFEMLLVASFSALVVIALSLTILKRWKAVRQLSWKQWAWFSVVGLLNPVIYYLVLFKSYDLLPAQVAQPINYFWPIVLLVMLTVVGRQPIAKIKYGGMALSLGGVTLISFGAGGLGGMDLSIPGLLLAFLSAFLWAAYWIVNKLNKQVDGIVALFPVFLSGSVYLLITALVMQVNIMSVPGILSAMYVGVFEMGIPFIFFGLALRMSSNPSLVNQMCYLSPFLSLFLISLFLGEKISPATYAGLSLIVGGILFNEYMDRRKSR